MKKIFLTLLLLGQIMMAATIQYIETNGVKVPLIFEKDERLPLATVQFIFTNSGSIADGSKAGLAKFSSKMMNEGTKKLGSSAFADMLEEKAIHIHSSIGTETFVLETGALKEQFDEALEYVAQLLADPNLSEDAFKKVKTTTIGGLSGKANDFDYVASNELKALLFEGTPLANPSSGTIESVESMTLEDVEKFLAKNIVSSRLIIAVGGDVSIKDIKEKLQKIIALLPQGVHEEVAHYAVRKASKESILTRDTKQAYIYFGAPFAMDVADKEYYKARVAAHILGAGGFGSRLMEEIRVKRGLAYSAYARIHVNKSSSYLSGYLQTKIESQKEAEKTVKEVIADFVKKGVSKEELKQTKKFLLGSEPLRVETMSQRLGRTFQEFYRGHELGYSLRELELIKDLKLKDLNSFIQEHTEINDLSFAIVTK
jgi:zinc protease